MDEHPYNVSDVIENLADQIKAAALNQALMAGKLLSAVGQLKAANDHIGELTLQLEAHTAPGEAVHPA